jgi:hypothetical protein
VSTPAAASAWLDAPKELRNALYAMAYHQGRLPWVGVEEDLPNIVPEIPRILPGLDADATALYLEHLATRYFEPSRWAAAGWSSGGELDLRAGLEYVERSNSPRLSGYAEAFGWTHRTGAAGRAAFSRHAGKLVVMDDPTDPDPTLSPRRCPHCDHAGLHALATIDVPDGVLCPNCRRMPSAPDLYFPDVHFLLWEGPFGNNSSPTRPSNDAIAGTKVGQQPATPTSWRRASAKCADGIANHRSRVSGECEFTPTGPDEEPRYCGRPRAPGAVRYCGQHSDRRKRAAERAAHQRTLTTCKTEGCENRPKPRGRGRPAVYCAGCRP